MSTQIFDDVKPLSKKLQVAPLKDGEVAVFRLTKAFLKDPSREEPTCPEVVQLSGVEQVNDPGEEGVNRSKKIATTIKEYKSIGKSGQVKPVYEPLIFIKGELRISAAEQAKYAFAMRSKKNTSNRFRKLMGASAKDELNTFYLLGSKENISVMKLADMQYYAEKLIREGTLTDLKEIAVTLNANPDQRFKVRSYIEGATVDSEKLKWDLIQLAKAFPRQVVAACPNDEAKLKVQIYDALVYGVLTFEKESYFLLGDNDMIEIHTPESDMDKVDSLIKFFMSDKAKYTLFARALKKALQIN